MVKSKKTKCYIYTRVSTAMQVRLDLIYDQMGDIEEKIETVNRRINHIMILWSSMRAE